MARDDRSLSGDHVNWWHLLAHAIAFCTAAAIGAILLYPSYPEFQSRTATSSEAFGAFLTCIVIAGGFGPMVTLSLFALYGLVARAQRARRRTASFRNFSNHPLTKR
jgi:ABC-type Fe3+ transport system permease subunit